MNHAHELAFKLSQSVDDAKLIFDAVSRYDRPPTVQTILGMISERKREEIAAAKPITEAPIGTAENIRREIGATEANVAFFDLIRKHHPGAFDIEGIAQGIGA